MICNSLTGIEIMTDEIQTALICDKSMGLTTNVYIPIKLIGLMTLNLFNISKVF